MVFDQFEDTRKLEPEGSRKVESEGTRNEYFNNGGLRTSKTGID